MHRARLSAAAMTAALLLAACANETPPENEKAGDHRPSSAQPRVTATVGVTRVPVEERRSVPPLEGPRLGGGKISLADYWGQIVVLNVWASWCGPCREEAPALRRLSRETTDEGVQFLGVNTRDSTAAARAFVREFDIGYPSFHDPDGSLVLRLRGFVPPQAVPATLIIDREGRTAVRIVGPTTYDQLRTLINAVKENSG